MAVAIAICSWFAISNHCAIAVTVPQEKIAPSECPYHSHPAKPAKQKKSTDQPCCKILRALAPSLLKNLTPVVVDLANVDLSFPTLVVLAPPKISFTSFALDTGPPGTTSFVELIGSMRAHAPPTRA